MRRPRSTLYIWLTAAIAMMSVSLLLAAPNASTDAPQAQLYRYINNKGTTVTSSKIPPEYAKKGYKIVTMSGLVIKEVLPELSEEEKKKIDANKLSESEQLEKDRLMLLRYGSIGELIRDKDRKLAELRDKVKSQEANLSAIEGQIKYEQQNAATFERSGREVPPATLAKIDALYKDQQICQEQISTFRTTYTEQQKHFDEDIARFEQLKTQRIRRDASASGQ